LIGIVQGAGETTFSGTITWFLKARGKSENVTVSLYRIEESESDKTKAHTLLKQFRRKYDVVCDNKECVILLFLKRHFGLCSCKPAFDDLNSQVTAAWRLLITIIKGTALVPGKKLVDNLDIPEPLTTPFRNSKQLIP
jgi:hypothetical protein